jgi:hypothetical protein
LGTHNRLEETMLDRSFIASPVGKAALASLAAMVAFNIFALTQQLGAEPAPPIAAADIVELA